MQIVGINARREAGWLIRMMLGIGARTFRRDMHIFLCETLWESRQYLFHCSKLAKTDCKPSGGPDVEC